MIDARGGITLGMKIGIARLRSVSAPLTLVLACTGVFALGVFGRRSDPSGALDNLLSTPVLGFLLPVLAYLVSERVCAGQRLDRSADSLARHGADRRAVVLGLLLTAALCTALSAALLALSAVFTAHTPGSLAFDVRSSVSIALLAGVVYALWFGAASLLGKRGGGRKWALILDFILGAGNSALAAPCPRAQVRNLLGGEPALGISQAHAWLALIAIGAVCALFSVTRTSE
ncbi:MAG: hypothetical protein ABJB12_11915 [Pseudomonadota bacterium]